MNVIHAGFYVSTEGAWVIFLFALLALVAAIEG